MLPEDAMGQTVRTHHPDLPAGEHFYTFSGGKAEHHLSTGFKHPGYIFRKSDGVSRFLLERGFLCRPRQQSGESLFPCDTGELSLHGGSGVSWPLGLLCARLKEGSKVGAAQSALVHPF